MMRRRQDGGHLTGQEPAWARGERAPAPDQLATVLFETSTQPIALLELNGNEVIFGAANPAYRRLVGLPEEALLGRALRDVLPPESGTFALDRCRHAVHLGEPITYEDVLEGMAGERRVEATLTPLVDDGSCRYLVMSLRDLSDERRARDALLEALFHLESVLTHAPLVLLVVDRSGTVTLLEGRGLSALGIDPNDVLDGAAEVTYERVPGLREAVERAFSGESFTERIRFGPHAFDAWFGPVRGADGAPISVMAVATDVSAHAEAEQALHFSEERFRLLAHSSPVGIYFVDRQERIQYANPRLGEIMGRDFDVTTAAQWWDAIPPDDRERAQRLWVARLADQEPFSAQLQIERPDGERRWVISRGAPMCDERGRFLGFVGSVEDVTEQVQWRRATEHLTVIVEASSDFIGITDVDGLFTYLNEAARRTYGLDPDQDPGCLTVFDVYRGESRRTLLGEVVPTVARAGHWEGELEITTARGETIPVSQVIQAHYGPDGKADWYFSVARDIRERMVFQRQLEEQALHDPLTGLPNRVLLADRLEQALTRSRRSGSRLAVLVLDVDRFRVINDSLGRERGDRLLLALAGRISDVLRPDDTVARLGGDEFAVVCEDVHDDALAVARRLKRAIATPFPLDGSNVHLSVSIGIATTGNEEAGVDDLLRDANAAQCRAKRDGPGTHRLFEVAMRTWTAERYEIESALRQAIDRGELCLHFQPLVSLADGQVAGTEALVRWQHPERGLLPPGEFVPLAEEAGLVGQIGAWVLEQACRAAAEWNDALPGANPTLWVNLSALQLSNPDLIPELRAIFESTDTDAATVGLDITETALMADTDAAVTTLRRLKRLGLHLSIDDFGTGYSSLSSLRRFPVDLLKIDRSFVSGLGHALEDQAIVTAQINMAHALGLRVVAEGVETVDQHRRLRALGCDYGQGFLFSPPIPAGAFERMLRRGPHW